MTTKVVSVRSSVFYEAMQLTKDNYQGFVEWAGGEPIPASMCVKPGSVRVNDKTVEPNDWLVPIFGATMLYTPEEFQEYFTIVEEEQE